MYCVEGQPYEGLPVFRIPQVVGEGKVKIVTRPLILLNDSIMYGFSTTELIFIS